MRSVHSDSPPHAFPTARTAAAKLDNAITSQNDSYLDSQGDQQALLLRCATAACAAAQTRYLLSAVLAGVKTPTWTT